MNPDSNQPFIKQIYERGFSKTVPHSDLLVCPKEFLQSWSLEALEAVRLKADQKEEAEKRKQIARRMGREESVVEELAQVCSPENLRCGNEPKSSRNLLLIKNINPYGVKLNCVNFQMKQRKFREENKSFMSACRRHMKYSFLDEHWFLKSAYENRALTEVTEQAPIPNVILTVQVTKCRMFGDTEGKRPLSETFIVLGSQTLAHLKDAIKCPLNSVIAGDFSSMPDSDESKLQKSGDAYKSGFFFIENMFYNDMRSPDNKDYSKQIREWAEKNWSGAQLSVSEMSTTKFSDLRFRLGHYYLFTHQGNCEHSVQFQDMRLFTSSDNQDASQYPIRTVQRIQARKLCQGCTKLSAIWIIFDSPLIPTDPCFLCQKCFKSLLYTPDGEKTSNFKAHHYTEYLF